MQPLRHECRRAGFARMKFSKCWDTAFDRSCSSGWDRSWVVYLEHPATRSSMPGDVRRCPAHAQASIRLGIVCSTERHHRVGTG